jgi:NAD(P)-dependent dehydrogenase (short-subunit alcohol dehydrogenase family)
MTIRDPEQVDALIATTYERFGRLDALVNNGGGQFPQSAIDFSVKGWHAVIDTNLNGTWYMMQSAAKQWRDRNEPGSIVNIVANVWRGMPQVAHTCAARAGVIYLSKTSPPSGRRSISVSIAWPRVRSRPKGSTYPTARPRIRQHQPDEAAGDVFDVAEAVVTDGRLRQVRHRRDAGGRRRPLELGRPNGRAASPITSSRLTSTQPATHGELTWPRHCSRARRATSCPRSSTSPGTR